MQPQFEQFLELLLAVREAEPELLPACQTQLEIFLDEFCEANPTVDRKTLEEWGKARLPAYRKAKNKPTSLPPTA